MAKLREVRSRAQTLSRDRSHRLRLRSLRAPICTGWLGPFSEDQHSSPPVFYSMYLMGSTRCGISAKQIQRETGVTYKTAWRMFNQIGLCFGKDLQLEGPTVEMDETYFGGKRKARHWPTDAR